MRSREPVFIADTVCSAETLSGAEVDTSPTLDEALLSQTSSSFGISPSVLSSIRAEARYASIEQVTFEMSNVSLSLLSDNERAGGTRSPACEEALESAIENNERLALISGTYAGDFRYKIEASSELGAQLDAALLNGLAPLIGVGGANVDASTRTIQGASLIFGVRARETNIVCLGLSGEVRKRCKTYFAEQAGG